MHRTLESGRSCGAARAAITVAIPAFVPEIPGSRKSTPEHDRGHAKGSIRTRRGSSPKDGNGTSRQSSDRSRLPEIEAPASDRNAGPTACSCRRDRGVPLRIILTAPPGHRLSGLSLGRDQGQITKADLMPQAGTLKTTTSNYLDLIRTDTVYRLPPYQRDCVWTEERWENLRDDITNLYQTPASGHPRSLHYGRTGHPDEQRP